MMEQKRITPSTPTDDFLTHWEPLEIKDIREEAKLVRKMLYVERMKQWEEDNPSWVGNNWELTFAIVEAVSDACKAAEAVEPSGRVHLHVRQAYEVGTGSTSTTSWIKREPHALDRKVHGDLLEGRKTEPFPIPKNDMFAEELWPFRANSADDYDSADECEGCGLTVASQH